MRRVLIVGAGQAGLQLALTLQAERYDVTLISTRTPEQIRSGHLDEMAPDFDLVGVAAGKGELGSLFERHAQRSPYTEPQRELSVAYVRGTHNSSAPDDSSAARFNALAGIGEVISYPGHTLDGACEILLLEGVPGVSWTPSATGPSRSGSGIGCSACCASTARGSTSGSPTPNSPTRAEPWPAR